MEIRHEGRAARGGRSRESERWEGRGEEETSQASNRSGGKKRNLSAWQHHEASNTSIDEEGASGTDDFRVHRGPEHGRSSVAGARSDAVRAGPSAENRKR